MSFVPKASSIYTDWNDSGAKDVWKPSAHFPLCVIPHNAVPLQLILVDTPGYSHWSAGCWGKDAAYVYKAVTTASFKFINPFFVPYLNERILQTRPGPEIRGRDRIILNSNRDLYFKVISVKLSCR